MTIPASRHFLLLLLSLVLLTTGCDKTKTKTGSESAPPKSIPTELVAAHTDGSISKKSTIDIVFTKNLAGNSPLRQSLSTNPFTITPHVEGSASWHNTNKLVFTPKAMLQPGQEYKVNVDLSSMPHVEDAPIQFSFRVRKQSYQLQLEALEPASNDTPTLQMLRGSLTTADYADAQSVEAMLKIQYPNQNHTIQWNHSTGGQRHQFTIGNIERLENTTSLELTFNGSSIGVDDTESKRIQVPGLHVFTVTSVEAIAVPERVLQITFSDPIKAKQDLRGIIRVGTRPLRFHIQGNRVTVYSTTAWANEETVVITDAVQNTRGKRLSISGESKQSSHKVIFARQKPAIRFVNKGNIIPTGKDVALPLDVLNVKAVNVEVLRVKTNNLPQFLQVNTFDGRRELNRVGRSVWKGKVSFEVPKKSDNQWYRVGLDLSELSKKFDSGLYHIKVNFGPQDILYHCTNFPTVAQQDSTSNVDGAEPTESSFWDNWDGGNWSERYRQRKNPCHPGFYRNYHDHKIDIAKNVVVSDIGVVAKKGSGNALTVITTDLNTADPLQGASVSLLDYQQELIVSQTVDNNGMARFDPDRKPFLIVVNHNEQEGFLRLVDGATLSVSHFDVGGMQISNGLKGFIYGERGVWRPGDKIYLTFILLDEEARLPPNHPVVFELRNSRQQLVRKEVQTSSVNGFYTFAPQTQDDAPTGNYTLKVTVGNATFTHSLKIETVLPNRLKIGLKFPDEVITGRNPLLQAQLSSAWLHGAIARGLKADIKVSLSPTKTSFTKFSDYQFDDLSRRVQLNGKAIFNSRLDNKGNAPVKHKLKIPTPPAGMLKAHFETRVFEPSGAFSTDRHSVNISPYDRYIGLKTPKGDKARGMLLTDKKHTVDLVGLNNDGLAAEDTEVDIALYKIKWRWWWQTGQERLADYAGSSSYTPVQKGTVAIKDGKGQWQFEVKYPSWGRYLLVATDKNGGHRAGKILYIDWPGWAGRAQKDNPGGAQVLSVTSDKKEYNVGETVTLTIPSSVQGRALVSLESGSRVLSTTWVETTKERTQYQFKATEEMTPNVYAHVMLVQPHQQLENDLPIRLYGITPISVVDPATRLTPVITSADNFEPERNATISVSEKNGRDMTYTVALVDEGLLGLTRYKTPNPWSYFYQRESLGVKTWDIYDWVAGAYSGQLERLLAIGGGDSEEEAPKKSANRFLPFVRFIGPFTLAAGASNSHTVSIPQYIGAGRIMVVGADKGAFGAASKTVTIKTPLMILATLPRVLGPQEEVDLPVNVFVLEDHLKTVSLNIKTSDGLEVIGDANQELKFNSTGDQLAPFRLKVANRTGIAKVDITATSGDEISRQTIEIDVRHPLLPVTNTFAHVLEPGEKLNTGLKLHGMPQTNQASLEVSRTPALNLGQRLEELVAYPHGCAEQTTSKAFPQVYLSRLMNLPAEKDQAIRDNIQAAINKLKGFQKTDGGFSYWQGQTQVNDWTTSYVGHFLLEAQNAGFLVPDEMITKWTTYQNKVAQGWVPPKKSKNWNTKAPQAHLNRMQLMQAYRLYTLALAGSPSLGSMNRLKESGRLDERAQWRLAAAYQLAGQTKAAKKMIAKLELEPADYRELSGTFGSALRDESMILETLVLLNHTKQALLLARNVSEKLSQPNWLSTQETAYALIALARFGLNDSNAGPIELAYKLAGQDQQTISTPKAIITQPLPTPDKKSSKLSFENKSTMPLFVNIQVTGLPDLSAEKASQKHLAMKVSYLDTSNRPIEIAALEQGTDFVAKVALTNTSKQNLKEIALSHLIPSGWELHNERLSPGASNRSNFDYQDIRDDRTLTYFSLRPKQTKHFTLRLNASYAGQYYLPVINAEAMYDARIHSRTAGRWVEVYRPGVSN